jgi:hypothetical protein
VVPHAWTFYAQTRETTSAEQTAGAPRNRIVAVQRRSCADSTAMGPDKIASQRPDESDLADWFVHLIDISAAVTRR